MAGAMTRSQLDVDDVVHDLFVLEVGLVAAPHPKASVLGHGSGLKISKRHVDHVVHYLERLEAIFSGAIAQLAHVVGAPYPQRSVGRDGGGVLSFHLNGLDAVRLEEAFGDCSERLRGGAWLQAGPFPARLPVGCRLCVYS